MKLLSNINKSHQLLVLVVMLGLFFVTSKVNKISADTACGPGWSCIGTATYLKVNNCAYNFGYCTNLDVESVTVNCPTGGGSGSCVQDSPGRLGCVEGGDPTGCYCTSSGETCSTWCPTDYRCSKSGVKCSASEAGEPCSGDTEPYDDICTGVSQDCRCDEEDIPCTLADGGTIGCCSDNCDSSCVGKCGQTNGCGDQCPPCGNQTCGDGECTGTETCATCSDDCGSCCGNGACDNGETTSTCSQDCPGSCGDNSCSGSENCCNCAADCGGCCGNGSCDCGETETSCSADCTTVTPPPGGGASCGNGTCGGKENKCNCPKDCHPSGPLCGNGSCDCGETNASCSADCPVTITSCGNGTCETSKGENKCTCAVDCHTGPVCGNGICDCGETTATCYTDCSSCGATSCGNDICDCGETYLTCNADCHCGDLVCQASKGENCVTCATDCGSCCGNGTCQSGIGENKCTCPADCHVGPLCGNDLCDCGEDSSTCPADCDDCGDGVCAGFETCDTCPSDCTCPDDCPCGTDNPWWQITGGNAYAGSATGYSIVSNIPTPTGTICIAPDCIASLITASIPGDDLTPEEKLTAGIPVTGGGGIDVNTYQTQRNGNSFAVDTTSSISENYSFFFQRYGMEIDPTSFPTALGNAQKPPSLDLDTEKPYLTIGSMTIQRDWQVASGETIIIFVAGDLTIRDNLGFEQLITVEEGGFLAFIVSGDIIIEDSVGNNDLDDNTPNLEGVYIADGELTVEGGDTDDRFVGAGTFVGWSGVNLERNFDDGASRSEENNQRPTELFVYRPDFIRNVPTKMQRANYVWQETN